MGIQSVTLVHSVLKPLKAGVDRLFSVFPRYNAEGARIMVKTSKKQSTMQVFHL